MTAPDHLDRWLGEIAANDPILVELVAPSGHELATHADIQGVRAAMATMEQRWDDRAQTINERIAASEERSQLRMGSIRDQLASTFHRGLTDAVTPQTRTLVVSQLVALVVIAGLAFGLR